MPSSGRRTFQVESDESEVSIQHPAGENEMWEASAP